MATIYMAGSIRGEEGAGDYDEIVNLLRAAGHDVYAPCSDEASEHKMTDRQIYDRDTQWILASDMLIADVSAPSHGVGYEISFAESNGKVIICVCPKGTSVSAMINGNPDIKLLEYKHVAEIVEYGGFYIFPPKCIFSAGFRGE